MNCSFGVIGSRLKLSELHSPNIASIKYTSAATYPGALYFPHSREKLGLTSFHFPFPSESCAVSHDLITLVPGSILPQSLRVMADASGVNHPLLKTLNAAQRRAVTSKADTVAILAGPGSGKTHTLTTRVVWLINHFGYQPWNIVVATFTVKASREMKERISKALGEEAARKIVLGTFHSIARRYLAVYGEKIGLSKKFVITDDGDSRAIIKRICERLRIPLDPHGVKEWISKRKVRGPWDEPANPGEKKKPDSPEHLKVFAEYKDHLERHNLLDYDDLLVKGVELLRRFPSCVKNVEAVLIDEYQDTNGIQYELMKLFASAKNRITVVGDPDQSIYGWRSAEIRNLHRLLDEFPRTDEISLEENYRSSQLILDASLKVIQQDETRYQKILKPTHHKGTLPVLRTLYSSQTEGEWVVGEVKRVILMTGGMLSYDDVAILLRSASLSRHIESALGKEGIPYKMVGKYQVDIRSHYYDGTRTCPHLDCS